MSSICNSKFCCAAMPCWGFCKMCNLTLLDLQLINLMLGIKAKWKMKVPLHWRRLKQSSANITHRAWVRMPWFWGIFACALSFSQSHYHLYVWSYCMMLNWIIQSSTLFIMAWHDALWCISITVLVDFAGLQPWGVRLVLIFRSATKFAIKWEILHGKLMTISAWEINEFD